MTQQTAISQKTGIFLKSLFVAICLPASAQDAANNQSYSPYAGETFARQVYWGDTHLHSNMSVDANSAGNLTLTPEDAYRLARGEEITATNGMRVRLRRPLDFLVVSDHAEYLGWLVGLRSKNETLLKNPEASQWSAQLDEGTNVLHEKFADGIMNNPVKVSAPEWEKTAWQYQIEKAEEYYSPGQFTTFIGYEWTGMPGGDNQHRVVVYGDGADKVGQTLPFSALESHNPEDLWAYLERYENLTGGRVLAIPHNSNVSGGQMFPGMESEDTPLSKEYAATRARWEPIVEMTQYKGDSETHPYLSPEDEFADYETWDLGNLAGLQAHENWMFQHEYARSALKLGLDIEAKIGVNPYQFGVIGSTDAHTGMATAGEDNFWGKFSSTEPSAHRWKDKMVEEGDNRFGTRHELMLPEWKMAASGYAAVWATDNTREALFDGMQRRETYATTGPRILVRLFGGWQFKKEDVSRPDIAKTGYSKGVPMGSVLPHHDGKSSPKFLIAAMKDSDGANLDRVQIIKGWLDRNGETHEKVFDVVWSGDRKPNRKGKLPAVGNTVDVASASYTNSIGAVQLNTVWEDPDFNPGEPAFYYARVIEIPTPRWTTYDAKYFQTQMPKEVPATTQERAYTSPIWYEPNAQ